MLIPNVFHRSYIGPVSGSNGSKLFNDGRVDEVLNGGRDVIDHGFPGSGSSQSTKSVASYRSRLMNDLAEAMKTSTPQQCTDDLKRSLVDSEFELTSDSQWQGWGAGEINDPKLRQEPILKRQLAAYIASDDKEVIGQLGIYDASGQRRGGHLVAFKGIDDGNSTSPKFSIYDPSLKSDEKIVQVTMGELESGALINGDKTTHAACYLKLNGMPSEEGDKQYILDGVYAFGLKQRKSA